MSSSRSTMVIAHVFRGTFVHSIHSSAFDVLDDTLLGVDTLGKVCLTGIFFLMNHLIVKRYGVMFFSITQSDFNFKCICL